MKEVKLRIHVKEIWQACYALDIRDPDLFIGVNKSIDYLAILKEIFKNGLEIEGECSDEEKKDILDIVKNNLYYYFIHNPYGVEAMWFLYGALKKNDESVRSKAFDLIDQLLKSNPYIYKREHGIHIQEGINDSANKSLRTRTYTLKVDDTDPSYLKSLVQLTSEHLDRELAFYLAFAARSDNISMYENYTFLKEPCYTFEDLYNLTKDDVPLVDYGLKFIYTNYPEIAKLSHRIMKNEFETKEDTANEIYKLFVSEENLRIAMSVTNNIEKIRKEKKVSYHLFKALEYMANNTELLKARDGSKALEINTDLSSFNKNYIVEDDRLRNICKEKEAELKKEIKKKEEALEEEERKKVKDRATINSLKHEIYLLDCAHLVAGLQDFNAFHLRDSMEILLNKKYSVQQKYLVKKIEEFEKTLNSIKAAEEASKREK
ncbi:hypothetical protein NEMIN01_2120, partial [Nematocida minor]|uniref:uncharacterized protein n=1 Tax=Nematocida minor TaxID=1912983 RepID=UPI00221FE4D9